MTVVQIFLVVPCFNETLRWSEEYWKKLAKVPNISIIFIDDGSQDSTSQVIKNFSENYHTKFRSLEKNCGKAEAVRQGWLSVINSKDNSFLGESIVGFVDADGAVGIEDILRLIEIFKGKVEYDALWSSRVALAGRKVNRKLMRHYFGRIFASIASIGIEEMPYDTQSGFKLFRLNKKFEACIEDSFRTKWLFELELISRWKKQNNQNMKIWEEPVNEWRDVSGSKVTLKEMLRICKELMLLKIHAAISGKGANGS